MKSICFNALLKTLEEPPSHVKFLLATTDPKRLPVTILSRCLQFNLKRVAVEQIAKQLEHICTTENIQFETPGLLQLAQAADGSMRDALSLLDQAIAFCQNNVKSDDVRRMLGNVEQDYIYRLLSALGKQDGSALLQEIKNLAEYAPDFDHILENVLSCLHAIAITQTIKTGSDAPEAVIELAQHLSPEDVQLYYQIALMGRRDLSLAPSPIRGFEMIMLRMLAFKPAILSTQTATPSKTAAAPVMAAAMTRAAPAKPVPQNTPASAAITSQAVAPISNNWTEILSQLGLAGMTQALAANCALEAIGDHKIELALSKKHQPMLNANSQERIEEALRRYFNKPISLVITISSAELNTSAKQQEEVQKSRHASAVEAITTDNQVQKIMDVFGATLDMNSIKAVDPEAKT
jgi:DNA polymerase-3 subunit gamma/tau